MHLDTLHITIIRFYLLFTFVLAGTLVYLSGGNRWIWWIILLAPSVYIISFPFWQFRMERRLLWLATFLFITIFSTLANMAFSSALIILIKDIFFVAGIWVFFAYFVVSQKEVIGLLKLLLFTACIQIIWVIPQYFFVRAIRVDQGLGTVAASDSVVGSFGGSMIGGGQTATFAFFQVCILIGLVCFRKYGVIADRKKYITYMILTSVPLLFTETKAIIVYFILASIILNASLIKDNFFKFAGNSMKLILLVAGLIISLQYFHWSAMGDSLTDNLILSSTYIFSDEAGWSGTQNGRMTRFQAVMFWWEYGFNNVGHLLFGHGLSASYTLSPDSSLMGAMASKFMPWQLDTTGLSLLLWDVGIVGALFLFTFLVHSSWYASRLSRSEKLNAWQQALAKTLQVIFLMYCLSLLYRHDIPYTATMMVLFMMSLGLLSYLSKYQNID